MKVAKLVASAVLALSLARAAAAGPEEEALPFLHPLFTDNAVVQRGVEFPVWGWTEPGAEVTVTMNGRSASATAGADGEWRARLGPFDAGGPYTLEARGPQTVTLTNVMAGDVWVCSGQSNMAMGIAACNNAREEIAAADYPNIRLFSVPNRISYEPQRTLQSSWLVCSPETVASGGWGGFSAAGYYFGRDLHKALDVPLGLIHSSWGGTVAEAWTSAEALSTMEDFRRPVEDFARAVEAIKSDAYDFDAKMKAWWEENDRGSQPGAEWFETDFDDSAWKTMRLPANWENAGLPNFDGVAWFRRSFDLPDDWAGRDVKLHLGPIDDRDVTWLNGAKVGELGVWNRPRVYNVPGRHVKAGRNVLAIRVLDTGGGGGIFGKPGQMKVERAGADAVSLAGDWRYAAAGSLGELTPMPKRLDRNPNVVTVLYNGMISPLLPGAIRGAIWYQGESNAGRARQYRTLLPTMIRDWRTRFGVGEFPFFIVQLANFMARTQEPVQSGWAELREAQLMTAENDPNVGLAVIIDIGEARDIHPKNKQDVGGRLALAARGIAYGEEIVHSGPVFRIMRRRRGAAYLRFDHVGGGLVAKGGGELRGFAVAGADGVFHHATAEIEGDTVIVSSPEVKTPVAVRYGWANNPVCNLYNKEGLPASPFRTDVD